MLFLLFYFKHLLMHVLVSKIKELVSSNSSIPPVFEYLLLSVQALTRTVENLPYSTASLLFLAQQHSTTSRAQGEWQIKELVSFQQQLSCTTFRRSPGKFRVSSFLCYSPPCLHVPAAVSASLAPGEQRREPCRVPPTY